MDIEYTDTRYIPCPCLDYDNIYPKYCLHICKYFEEKLDNGIRCGYNPCNNCIRKVK